LKIDYALGSFTSDDVVKYLNLSGQQDSIYADIIRNQEVRKKAQELSLTVSDQELQQFVDDFRSSHGMYSAEETLDQLARAGLTIDDLEMFCETALLINKLMNHLADEAKIESYFVNNRAQFDQARLSIILVEKIQLANELIMQVTEDEADFHTLARKYSLDSNSRYAGGYIGLISRDALTDTISAKVFNAGPAELLGPFEANGFFQLILVEELIKPELDTHIKDQIRQALFMEWLAPALQNGVQCT
jgi:parvulin-like peptidyl-prolyl isomerase